MILTTLNDSQRIEPLHPLFKTLFDYVKQHNLLDAPLGRIEIDGDNLFINNSLAEGVLAMSKCLRFTANTSTCTSCSKATKPSGGNRWAKSSTSASLTTKLATANSPTIAQRLSSTCCQGMFWWFIPRTRTHRLSATVKSENLLAKFAFSEKNANFELQTQNC